MVETRHKNTKKDNKKMIFAIIILAVIFFVIAFFLITTFGNNSKDIVKEISPIKKEPPKPVKIKSPYTGIELEETIYSKRPLAVVIENSTKARPQSGLSNADWVFETVAEGGITRMLAVFHSENPESIGPIRSAREYFVSISKGIDAVFIHAGGSPGAYQAISNLFVTSIDGIKEGKPFNRISERRAPHNLYSSAEKLRSYIQERGYEGNPAETGYVFISEKANPEPEIDDVEVNHSSSLYKTFFRYDITTGKYDRFLADKQDIDLRANKKISVDNVVILTADITSLNEAKGRMDIQTEGTGNLFFFTRGKLIKGKWIRPEFLSPYKFVDEAGIPIEFSKGKTWFSIISSEEKIKY